MAIENILILSAAYIVPLIFLALLMTQCTRIDVLQKIALLVLLPIFYLLHYHSLLGLPGWPSHQTLPDTFTLISQQIKEPDKRTNYPGHIWLWVQAEQNDTSRLYEMPYTKALHKKLAAASQRQSAGKQQQGRKTSGNTNTSGGSTDKDNTLIFSDKKTYRPPAKINQIRRNDAYPMHQQARQPGL